jgi:excisionase family DNA binding protein
MVESTVLDKPSLLTREAAAEYLGIQAQTLAAWASAKRYSLPYIKIGRCVRYRKRDLDRFLAARTVGAAAGDE